MPRITFRSDVPSEQHQEAPTHPVVNTLGLPPRLLDTMVSVRLVSLEVLCALLDDGDVVGCHFLPSQRAQERNECAMEQKQACQTGYDIRGRQVGRTRNRQ